MAVSHATFVMFCSLIGLSMQQWMTYSAFGSAVAVDSILAATTIYYLRRSRGEFEA